MLAYVAPQGIPGQAVGTANFLAKVDKIFDCCNSLSFKGSKICRRPFTATSPHKEVITEGIEFFKSVQAISHGTEQSRTASIKCYKGWQISLKAILLVWEKLCEEDAASFLVTRQMNQDPLENFFGAIRQQGGNSGNPIPVQFKSAYKKLFPANVLTVSSGNCGEDMDNSLTKLSNKK
eukprot:Seg2434.2 transcript_id=Seg2434.2/GoldUCD/mRNA.D3Y31 product="Transposable element P transposase" protein_id=Seg2434.2/GoldUCD/D3Y31